MGTTGEIFQPLQSPDGQPLSYPGGYLCRLVRSLTGVSLVGATGLIGNSGLMGATGENAQLSLPTWSSLDPAMRIFFKCSALADRRLAL